MSEAILSDEFSWKRKGLTGFCTLVFIIFASAPLPAANMVAIPEPGPGDTLWFGQPTTLDIYLENDIILGAMSLGFQVWSPDGATWTWLNVGGLGAITGCVTVNPACRLDPAVGTGSFNLTGFIVNEQNVDEVGRDTIMCGGVATIGGLPPGPLEYMYSYHFIPVGPDNSQHYTICFDSCFVPPSGNFVFVDGYGDAFPPAVTWDPGGVCWPVGGTCCQCPEWNMGNPTAMTVDHCGSHSVTLAATDVEGYGIQFQLGALNGGAGAAQVIDNGNGTCVVTYTPVVADVDQAISIVVDVTDAAHNWGECTSWTIDVTVANNPPVLDSGFYYKWGATENPVTKDDIGVVEAEGCDDHEYFMVAGPGEIDPITGVYYWLPGPADSGDFIVEIGVSDGNAADTGSFQVGIADQACCPGDVNYTGAVNVGDAMSLINYIFKGGNAPLVINWADPNADCQVNVGDVIYLINYIFRSGPAPLLGCVYP